MQKQVQLGLILVICLLMGACALPASTRPGLSVHLEAPRSGMVVALPVTAPNIVVLAQAHAPAGDVTRMIFYANGLVIGEDTSLDLSGDSALGRMLWIPTEAGEYLVQAEALRSDGSAFSAAARVCVITGRDDANPEGFQLFYGYTGSCATYFWTATPTELPPFDIGDPIPAVGMTARAIPASLAYDWMCPGSVATPTIAFEATVDDPGDRVIFVTVEYSLPTRGDPTGTRLDFIGLNWTASLSTGEKIFTGTTDDLLPMLQGELQGDGGLLTWTARAFGRGAEVLALDGPHDILASPCTAAVIGVPMPIVIEPTETPTPLPTPTLTPTLVPVPTKKPGGGGGGSCADHGKKDACVAAGCNWDPAKMTCS